MKKTILTFALTAFAAVAYAEELTLDEALDFALNRSPAAVAAEATYLSARADLYQGWGGIMPNASVTYSASRYYDRETLQFGGFEIPGYVPPDHYYYAEARVDQPIFAGGRLIWGVLSGRASGRAGNAGRDEQRQRLVVDVARAYFGALKATGLKEVADLSLEASRKNEELALAQYEADAISRAEYLRAVVQRGSDEINAISAEAAVETARLAFFNTVGMEPDPDLTFVPGDAPAPPGDLPSLDELIARASRQRPDAVRIREEKRIAELGVRSASGGWLPTLAASAAYDWSDYDSPSADTWDANDEWIVGIAASWSLFDGFQTKANVDRARAAAIVARTAYDRLDDTVALDVTQAYYEYKKQAETVVVAKETADAAREELLLVQELFALGGASTLELTDAQALGVGALNSLVDAEYDFRVAEYDLKRALGEIEH
ncbi:MAG: TolC family protein [Candidatus Zixiibacteriota bacterium]|jgi:outer membrane protein